ncbi:hypothetical protein ACJRO7_017216 [Eucalyptus globulus]|uniref:Uncharacterized protein n=1 Tax=Eucalyptus globulus TaxID=34317 RepID=A0ABD3KQS0_EUCGL
MVRPEQNLPKSSKESMLCGANSEARSFAFKLGLKEQIGGDGASGVCGGQGEGWVGAGGAYGVELVNEMVGDELWGEGTGWWWRVEEGEDVGGCHGH